MAAKHLLLDDLHLQVAQRLAIRFSGHLVFVTLNNTRDGFLGHQVRCFKSSFLPVLPTTPGLCKQDQTRIVQLIHRPVNPSSFYPGAILRVSEYISISCSIIEYWLLVWSIFYFSIYWE